MHSEFHTLSVASECFARTKAYLYIPSCDIKPLAVQGSLALACALKSAHSVDVMCEHLDAVYRRFGRRKVMEGILKGIVVCRNCGQAKEQRVTANPACSHEFTSVPLGAFKG